MLVFIGRQISFEGGLIFYVISTGTKACVTAADLIDSDENLHCFTVFTLPLSSCCNKIFVVSQCRCTAGISWLFIIWTHSCSRFFHWLTTCTCWTAQWHYHCWRGLTQTELADWRKHKTQIWNWLRQWQPGKPIVHYLQTVRCGLPLRQMAVNDGRTAASSAAVSWWHHMHKKCYY